MFALINYALFGLWSMLTYRYFSLLSASLSIDNNQLKNNNGDNGANQHSKNSMINASAETDTTKYIFNAEEQPGVIENSQPFSTTTTTVAAIAVTAAALERQYSFNIFDGTNASSAFADFIHDGDSDDELAGNEESARWSAVQDHV